MLDFASIAIYFLAPLLPTSSRLARAAVIRLAATVHHASRLCPPGRRPHAVDPSVRIGLRRLAVGRIGDDLPHRGMQPRGSGAGHPGACRSTGPLRASGCSEHSSRATTLRHRVPSAGLARRAGRGQPAARWPAFWRSRMNVPAGPNSLSATGSFRISMPDRTLPARERRRSGGRGHSFAPGSPQRHRRDRGSAPATIVAAAHRRLVEALRCDARLEVVGDHHRPLPRRRMRKRVWASRSSRRAPASRSPWRGMPERSDGQPGRLHFPRSGRRSPRASSRHRRQPFAGDTGPPHGRRQPLLPGGRSPKGAAHTCPHPSNADRNRPERVIGINRFGCSESISTLSGVAKITHRARIDTGRPPWPGLGRRISAAACATLLSRWRGNGCRK
jgi:hypothetical protein